MVTDEDGMVAIIAVTDPIIALTTVDIAIVPIGADEFIIDQAVTNVVNTVVTVVVLFVVLDDAVGNV